MHWLLRKNSTNLMANGRLEAKKNAHWHPKLFANGSKSIIAGSTKMLKICKNCDECSDEICPHRTKLLNFIQYSLRMMQICSKGQILSLHSLQFLHIFSILVDSAMIDLKKLPA